MAGNMMRTMICKPMRMFGNTTSSVRTAATLTLVLSALVGQAQRPAPAPAQERSVLITGGTVHVGDGRVVDEGAVGFRNGRIDYVGYGYGVTATYDTVIQAKGLTLDGGWGEHHARIAAHPALDERPELAILATKAQDAATALAANATRLEGVPLVVVQNGLGGLDVARRELRDAPLLGALALFAASYLEPGHITVTGPNPVVLGAAASNSRRNL